MVVVGSKDFKQFTLISNSIVVGSERLELAVVGSRNFRKFSCRLEGSERFFTLCMVMKRLLKTEQSEHTLLMNRPVELKSRILNSVSGISFETV